MKDSTRLTLGQALEIQSQHLKEWQSVLNDKTYQIAYEICMLKNKTVTNPYDVFRGNDISSLVENIKSFNLGNGGVNPYEIYFNM